MALAQAPQCGAQHDRIWTALLSSENRINPRSSLREGQRRTSGALHPDLSSEVIEHNLPIRPGFRNFGFEVMVEDSRLYVGSRVYRPWVLQLGGLGLGVQGLGFENFRASGLSD